MTDEVLTSLRGAVTALPDDVALRLHLAELLLAGGAISEAVQHTAVVLERDPENGEALMLMARALRTVPDTPAAAVDGTEDLVPEMLADDAPEALPEPDDGVEAPAAVGTEDFDWHAAAAQAARELIARLWLGLIGAHIAILGGLVYARFTSGSVPLRGGAVIVLLTAIGLGTWRLMRRQANIERKALMDAIRSDPPIMSGVVTASIGTVLLIVALCTGGLAETDAELAAAATLLLGILLLITLASASRQPD